MPAVRRATICFDTRLYSALRLKAAETGLTISSMVNDAVRAALAEDADDLAAIHDRASEPVRPFGSFAKRLHRRARR